MSADVFTKQQMDRMGVKAFISKPFDVNELQQMIESL
jgi:FixJ family two-component response regulator